MDARADVGQASAQQQDGGETGAEHELQDLRERIDPVGAAEEHGLLAQAEGGGGERPEGGDQRDEPGAGGERFTERDEEKHEPAGEKHQLGEEREKKGRVHAGSGKDGGRGGQRVAGLFEQGASTEACMTWTNGLRMEANPEDEYEQRGQGDDLAEVEVGEPGVHGIVRGRPRRRACSMRSM